MNSKLVLFLLATLAIVIDARYVLQEVWIKSAVVPGPYCTGTTDNPPPDYVIYTPIGVCQAHNVRETYNTGKGNYSVMYTYSNDKLKLHYYSDAECNTQTSVSTINMTNTCQYFAEENPRYLCEYSYVRFSFASSISAYYSEHAYSVTTYESTKPKCTSSNLLFNLQWSPSTCILAGRAGPYESNGRCTPTSTVVNVAYCEGDNTCSEDSCTFEQVDTADNVCRLGQNLDMLVGGVDRSEIVTCLAPSS